MVETREEWRGIEIVRTEGQHGRGEIGRLMAPVCGFVLKGGGEPVVYIAGDTIWCAEVQQAVDQFQPRVIVVNAGAAQFTSGGPITMTADDVRAVAKAAPRAKVIAVHMEAINHCLLSRSDLRIALQDAGLAARVAVPEDGQRIMP